MMPELIALLSEVEKLRLVATELAGKLVFGQKVIRIMLAVLAAVAMLTIVVSVLAVRSVGESQRVARQVDRAQAQIEINAHAQAVFNWNLCQRSFKNTTKLNEATNVFIKFLESNNKPPRPAITQWIKIQRGALLIVPECGPRP
jgi:hypothetical protein